MFKDELSKNALSNVWQIPHQNIKAKQLNQVKMQ